MADVSVACLYGYAMKWAPPLLGNQTFHRAMEG